MLLSKVVGPPCTPVLSGNRAVMAPAYRFPGSLDMLTGEQKGSVHDSDSLGGS